MQARSPLPRNATLLALAVATAAGCAGPRVPPASPLAFQRVEPAGVPAPAASPQPAAEAPAPTAGSAADAAALPRPELEIAPPADRAAIAASELVAPELVAPDAGASPLARASAGASVDAVVDDVEVERALRHRLATAEDPTEAVLELAALLTDTERHAEAIAALDAALLRVRSTPLRIARAGVCRDLGRRHEAVAELRALRRELGAAELHPRLLHELAELEWLEGDRAAARDTLATLAEVHAEHSWTKASRGLRQKLLDDLADAPRPRRMSERDLLGNLRGAPLATERLAVFEMLVRGDALPEAARASARARAITVALDDVAEALRARAVQLVELDPAFAPTFCRRALTDPGPLVRRCAATRCGELPAEVGSAVLFEHLAGETHDTVWAAAHDVLRRWHAGLPPCRTVALATATDRADLLATWRAAVPQ